MRDGQKTRMYRWEDRIVAPRDTTRIDINTARAVVQHVWHGEGLLYPPDVQELPAHSTRFEGTGSRTLIRLKIPTKTWLVLHELSHTLNTSLVEPNDGHGPNYLGIYMRLVSKYMDIPLPLLMFTASEAKLSFNLAAKYGFVDA